MPFLNFINGFFGSPLFFWAGLICAFGPIIIHLLNRRRFRVVEWAAMDFLREALKRNRRIMQIRDMLLLALRTIVILFLGLALAQTRCTSSSEKFDGSRPLHAVLLVDNSLSMGYQAQESLGEDLLDRAKQRARDYIGKLPVDSRVSVIPLCGSRHPLSVDPYTKEDALEALSKIEVVDGSARVQEAINEARKACETGPELDRRVLFFSDQQLGNWVGFKDSELKGLPGVQVVDVSAAEYENTWISDLRVPDGLADVETPTTFIVELRHQGAAARQNLQVTLTIDGVEAAAKTITLEAGEGEGAREVSFEHVFSAYQPEPGKPVQVAVKASIAPDRLPADDERHLVVNVVAALPVVFVDQYGSGEEDAVKSKLGETRHLRKLLAPVASRGETSRQLVKVRHVKIEDLSRDVLADARLVVVAGIADPGAAVKLLREYVEQGGQLILAAGAEFDAQRWNETAWLDGAGILPAALRPDPLGAIPGDSDEPAKPFTLSFESLGTHDYFRLADVTEDELRDLYAEPYFFKAIVADVGPAVLEKFKEQQVERLKKAFQVKPVRERPANEQSEAGEEESSSEWLLWKTPFTNAPGVESPADLKAQADFLDRLAQEALPVVRARFADEAGTPYLVERKIGSGQVLFVASGLLSPWNTLPRMNTFLIYDRIMRRMIESTLPNRNFEPVERITLPVPVDDQLAAVFLRRPGHEDAPEVLDAGFIGKDLRGVTVQKPLIRGLYRISAMGNELEGATPQAERLLWEIPLCVNGPGEESNLVSLGRAKFAERIGEANLSWVGQNEEISLAGTQIKGQNTWRYLIATLCLLFVELAIVSWPALSARLAGASVTPPAGARVEVPQRRRERRKA